MNDRTSRYGSIDGDPELLSSGDLTGLLTGETHHGKIYDVQSPFDERARLPTPLPELGCRPQTNQTTPDAWRSTLSSRISAIRKSPAFVIKGSLATAKRNAWDMGKALRSAAVFRLSRYDLNWTQPQC